MRSWSRSCLASAPLVTTSSVSFLAVRRPPISTLFPYTTLFRSASARRCALPRQSQTGEYRSGCRRRSLRSEEHTSELQSHSDLVCRLLLEKKKRRGRSVLVVALDPGGVVDRAADRAGAGKCQLK